MNNWAGALRTIVWGDEEPASRTWRYLSRLIEHQYSRGDRGVCLALTATEDERISTNTALMLAHCLQSELGSSVLIIDARYKDIDAGITGRLGYMGKPGFGDLLRGGSVSRLDHVQPTAVAGVSVIPAGGATPNDTAPINRATVRMLFDLAVREYNHVLVQLGAVLGDTRNIVVAAEADAVLVVTTENLTLLKTLDECQRVLRDNGADDVRIVVTADRSG